MEYFMDWKFPLFPFNIDFLMIALKANRSFACLFSCLFSKCLVVRHTDKKRKGMCLTLVLRFNWLSFALHNQFSNIVEKLVLEWTIQKIYVMVYKCDIFNKRRKRKKEWEKKRKNSFMQLVLWRCAQMIANRIYYLSKLWQIHKTTNSEHVRDALPEHKNI